MRVSIPAVDLIGRALGAWWNRLSSAIFWSNEPSDHRNIIHCVKCERFVHQNLMQICWFRDPGSWIHLYNRNLPGPVVYQNLLGNLCQLDFYTKSYKLGLKVSNLSPHFLILIDFLFFSIIFWLQFEGWKHSHRLLIIGNVVAIYFDWNTFRGLPLSFWLFRWLFNISLETLINFQRKKMVSEVATFWVEG